MTDNEAAIIDEVVQKARMAQQAYEAMGSQELFDDACAAVGWALMEPGRNAELAELAVAETGLGNVADKIKKNHNKTLGLLRDLQGARSTGHIHDDVEKGLSIYYRPKGVIAAIVPSTNPLATPVNNIINALKTGNAIIIAPSPKGVKPGVKLLSYIHAHLRELGLPDDLVQIAPSPPSKAKTERLMQIADLVVVTGSQNNVRAGYRSGTPAIGVGAGNVVTIIDETADISGAAEKIAASKTFDNATSCSSENSVIAISSVYEDVCHHLQEQGGLILTEEEGERLRDMHWHHGKMTGKLLAKDIEVMVKELGLKGRADADTRFLVIPQERIDKNSPLTSEKMSRFLTLYRVDDFEDATRKAVEIQSVLGAGHSLGLHTSEDNRAHALALQAQSCRIIVNQAHCFATGGFFNNGMPFSLSMGCGSWGKNSIDENLNWTHFVNKVNVVRVIPENKPELKDMFSSYWEKYGK